MILKDLYKKVSDIPVGDFPPSALSGLLHGYLSVYSMVRVNPWLEEVYGSQWDIHERVREIAGELADLINDPSIAVEDRVGHVADLMECYLVYSDMDFLDIALDAAYGMISKEGSSEIVLPCRTPEMCRLLCSCYYFTNEEGCAELAGEIVKEWKTRGEKFDMEQVVMWNRYRVEEFYENTVGSGEGKYTVNTLSTSEPVLTRCMENFKDENSVALGLCFDLLATKEYINLK